jgi:hypothetical protein
MRDKVLFSLVQKERSVQQKDLVYLSYAPNARYSTVTDTPPPGVAVQAKAGTWSYQGRTYEINSMRRCDRGAHYGPIGVYDKSDVENLARMARDWKEASKEPASCAFSE